MLAELRNNWIETTARRPSGKLGKKMYANPTSHKPGFYLLLKHLQLRADDYLAEVGCGGGVLMGMALETAGRACAVDHSADMVALAGEQNAEAIRDGRLDIRQSSGESLPWEDDTFTCIVNANMFFFVEDPVAFLRESRRVLQPGGRLAMVTAPDTPLSRMTWGILYSLRLYDDSRMTNMLRDAGFTDVRVKTRMGHQICLANKPRENDNNV